MRRHPAALSIILALHAIPAMEADSGEGTTLRGESEAKLEQDGTGRYLATRSRSYELTQFAYKNTVRTAVVEAEIRHRQRISEDLGQNGDETGTVMLTVYPLSASGHFDAPLATRKLPGDEIKVEGSGGVKIISWGCCVESKAETQLSLNTLKTLYVKSSNMPLLTYTRLGKPAVGRTASVYTVFTPADKEVLGDDPSAVAIITWASDDEPLQRIVLRLRGSNPREAAMSWSTTLGWKIPNAPLDSHTVFDPSRPTKPVLLWQIDEGRAIALPLVGDRFDVASAKLPEGISLKEISQ